MIPAHTRVLTLVSIIAHTGQKASRGLLRWAAHVVAILDVSTSASDTATFMSSIRRRAAGPGCRRHASSTHKVASEVFMKCAGLWRNKRTGGNLGLGDCEAASHSRLDRRRVNDFRLRSEVPKSPEWDGTVLRLASSELMHRSALANIGLTEVPEATS